MENKIENSVVIIIIGFVFFAIGLVLGSTVTSDRGELKGYKDGLKVCGIVEVRK